MFYEFVTRRLPTLAVLIGAAAFGLPASAQHGRQGGHHYSGHRFGRVSHPGFGHHYVSVYYGLGSRNYGSATGVYFVPPPAVAVTPPAAILNDDGSVPAGSSRATIAGLNYRREIESAFRSHQYEEAMGWGQRAAKETPRDGRLFLMLSQIHLAVGEYRDAAGTARRGMSLLPTEDWGYVVMNFRDYYHDADYVAQIRRLGQSIEENPLHADARFLLGYHWLFLGHSKSAGRELTKATELNPRDEWANRLLDTVDGRLRQSRPAPPEPVSSARQLGNPNGASESPLSVDKSIQYQPPQEFDTPLTTGGRQAAEHKHEESGQ